MWRRVSRLNLRHPAMFKAINTDDGKIFKSINMKAMVSKTFMKVIGFAGSLFLTLFAGLFGFISVSALFMSIIEGDLFNMVGCVAAGLAACWCWALRKVPLI